MRTLLVYADFDWLPAPTLIGELGYESLRGTDSYSFRFSEEWLQAHGGLYLSADLNNYQASSTPPAIGISLVASRMLSLTDGGRTLHLRREQILAREEKRPLRRLSSSTTCWGSMTTLVWEPYASGKRRMATSSTAPPRFASLPSRIYAPSRLRARRSSAVNSLMSSPTNAGSPNSYSLALHSGEQGLRRVS